METIKKIQLVPNGTTHSVEPKVRPSFNTWQHELRSRERKPIESENYFDFYSIATQKENQHYGSVSRLV